MDSTVDARVIPYRDEVIVEIQGTDEHGTIDVISYQFAIEDDRRTLSPKGPLDDSHRPEIEQALRSEGFDLVTMDE